MGLSGHAAAVISIQRLHFFTVFNDLNRPALPLSSGFIDQFLLCFRYLSHPP